MGLLKYGIPIMVLVFVISNMYLNNSYSELPSTNRLYISLGAALLSGVISHFMFRKGKDEE